MDATRTTPLRERMRQELQLAGLSERTQEAYLRSVRQLATHFGKPPDQVTEPELRQYLLFLKKQEDGPYYYQVNHQGRYLVAGDRLWAADPEDSVAKAFEGAPVSRVIGELRSGGAPRRVES